MDGANPLRQTHASPVLAIQNKAFGHATNPSLQRRTAEYKPNIWKYELLQSLTNEHREEEYKQQAQKLQKQVSAMFINGAEDPVSALRLIDSINKLGLDNLFQREIIDALDNIVATKSSNIPSNHVEDDLYPTALLFRLLRLHGYNVSQEMFRVFMDDETGTLRKDISMNVKTMVELYEASHLGAEGEGILDEAKAFSYGALKSTVKNTELDDETAKELHHAMDLPMQWSVQWYNIKRQIHAYQQEDNSNNSKICVELARLNFNLVQITHQKELGDMAKWWKNLGVSEKLSFTRDRLVESYLWAVGTAFEPQHGSFRKWLTKAIQLVLTIDDVYDIYGSLEELECFTNAVDRWDPMEIHQLPACMKICFQALYTTTTEVANEIQKSQGWKSSVLIYLQRVWADFCKALLVEAKWYHKGHTPSLQEYLDNGWISSCGPVLALHAFFSVIHNVKGRVSDFLKITEDLVHHTSMIIRLCNDLGTSAAELERGDAPSSILCFMREANVSEEIAREHIRSMIKSAWKKINSQYILTTPSTLQPFYKCVTNMARVVQFIYKNGDGFGVQDRETREQVLSLLIEPLPLIIS